MFLKFMVILPFRRLFKSEDKVSLKRLGRLSEINKKLISNPKKKEKIIKTARREFKEININIEKLLNGSKDLKNIKKLKR